MDSISIRDRKRQREDGREKTAKKGKAVQVDGSYARVASQEKEKKKEEREERELVKRKRMGGHKNEERGEKKEKRRVRRERIGEEEKERRGASEK